LAGLPAEAALCCVGGCKYTTNIENQTN